MGISEFRAALDDAIHDAQTRRLRRGDGALELTAPEVLGERGTRIITTTSDGETLVEYAYTLAQCRRLRDRIDAAARADMGR